MKNDYTVNGDTTIIHAKFRGNPIDVLIDTNDLDKVLSFKGTWSGRWDNRNIYVTTVLTKDKIKTHTNIHKAIMGTDNFLPYIDHKDGNTLDNRKDNLRFCTCQQNNMNSKPRKGTSIYKGVSWSKRKKKWETGIFVNKKTIHLGYYKSEEEAALVYNLAASIHFGEFARLNEVS